MLINIYTNSNKFILTQRELKGLEARHWLKIIIILLLKLITRYISLLNSPF